MSRRRFLASTAAASVSTLAIGAAPPKPAGSKRPIAVSSGNGLRAVEKAIELVRKGHDPLDAAIEGVAIIEADPKDRSVGLGGLPNEDGSSSSTPPSCTDRPTAAAAWPRSATSCTRRPSPGW